MKDSLCTAQENDAVPAGFKTGIHTCRALGLNFHRNIKSVLEGLWKRLYPHFIRLGQLDTFPERMRAEKYLRTPGTLIPYR